MATLNDYEKLWGQAEKIGPQILERLKVTKKLMEDEEVPLKTKAIIPLAAGAAVWLFKNENIIPDSFPVIGRLDNAALAGGAMWLGAELFELLCPAEAVAKAYKEVKEETRKRQETVDPYKKGTTANPVKNEAPRQPPEDLDFKIK